MMEPMARRRWTVVSWRNMVSLWRGLSFVVWCEVTSRLYRLGLGGVGSAGLENEELAGQTLDSLPDVVTDAPDSREILTGRVLELPVFVALAGKDGAGVAASHRDDHVGNQNQIVREDARGIVRDVDTGLSHGCDGDRVHLVSGFRSGRKDVDAIAGDGTKKAGRHLGTASIVYADEEDARLVDHICRLPVPANGEAEGSPRFDSAQAPLTTESGRPKSGVGLGSPDFASAGALELARMGDPSVTGRIASLSA